MTLILLFVALLQAAQLPAAAPVGNVEAGKRLYDKQTCYFCHGTAGQGGVAGARVAGVVRNPVSFIRYVRRPSGSMPAYSEKMLSDQELTDILAYLRSLPPAKPVSDIPLLNQLRGK